MRWLLKSRSRIGSSIPPRYFWILMPSGIFQILPGLLAGPPETDEIHDPPAVPVQQHHPVAGARQRPGAVHHTPQHRVEIEAVVDPQAGLDQPRQPVPQIPHAAQANAPPARRSR